jgi:hypothetical protein
MLYNARTILSDLRQLGQELWERFNVKEDKQLWYYRGLVTAFREAHHIGSLSLLVEELDRVVTEIDRKAGLRP